jgi:hypothetical protein
MMQAPEIKVNSNFETSKINLDNMPFIRHNNGNMPGVQENSL